MMLKKFTSKIRARMMRLHKDQSGVAAMEFALAMPFMLTICLTGTETVYFVQQYQQVSQLALNAADNGSRVGSEGALQKLVVYESDINDIFAGIELQMQDAKFLQNSRVIMSSIEYDAGSKIYVHWQRCTGEKDFDSAIGPQGFGAGSDALANGVKVGGARVKPVAGDALIVVEVAHDFQPLFGLSPFTEKEIIQKGAFAVRDTRDLAGLYDRTGSDPVATCA